MRRDQGTRPLGASKRPLGRTVRRRGGRERMVRCGTLVILRQWQSATAQGEILLIGCLLALSHFFTFLQDYIYCMYENDSGYLKRMNRQVLCFS